MNETLSPSQANRIVSEETKIVIECTFKMQTKSDEFIENVSKIWEDNNAVDFAKAHKNNMEKIVKQLNQNNRIFTNAVEEIANRYTKVGNMPTVTVERVDINGNFVITPIKPVFDDGNGDDFGFKNPKTGVEQVMDAFETLKSELNEIALDAVNRINSINAFGNPEVKINLARSAGRIIQILDDEIARAKTTLDDFLKKTADAYIRTGENATSSANLGEGNSGGASTPSSPKTFF